MSERPSPTREASPPTDTATSRTGPLATPDALGKKTPRDEPKRRLRNTLLDLLVRGLARAFAAFSWRTCQQLGAGFGEVGWRLSRRDRARALAHLEIAFPQLEPSERFTLARRSFRHLGMSLGESLHLFHADCAEVDAIATVAGWSHVEAARETGRPLLLITAHCGCWELLNPAVGCRGVSFAAVARQLDDDALDHAMGRLRAKFGHETIRRGTVGAARRLLSVLRSGGTLAMLIDQDIKTDGVWVPFFGRLAHTPVGAAQIAIKHRAVVIPMFAERLATPQPVTNGTAAERAGKPRNQALGHRITFHPPLDLPTDLTAATAVMTAAIEAQIRRNPEQWVWMHKRWRRRPPAELSQAELRTTSAGGQ